MHLWETWSCDQTQASPAGGVSDHLCFWVRLEQLAPSSATGLGQVANDFGCNAPKCQPYPPVCPAAAVACWRHVGLQPPHPMQVRQGWLQGWPAVHPEAAAALILCYRHNRECLRPQSPPQRLQVRLERSLLHMLLVHAEHAWCDTWHLRLRQRSPVPGPWSRGHPILRNEWMGPGEQGVWAARTRTPGLKLMLVCHGIRWHGARG